MIKTVKVRPAGMTYKFSNGIELDIVKAKEDSGWLENVEVNIKKGDEYITNMFFPNASKDGKIYVSSMSILMLMNWIDKTQL